MFDRDILPTNKTTAVNSGWPDQFRCSGSHHSSGEAEFQR
jgi:hypothetical protein